MTRTLIFATGFALAGALAASTTAFAEDQNMIDTVKVEADLGDINQANALNYWPSIEEDLAKVIEAQAGPLVSDAGYDVTVVLKELSLSGSKLLTGNGEFNRLEGWVYFRPDGENVAQDQHNIIIDAKTGTVPDSAIGVIVPGKPEFYAAVLEGFADATLKQLQELDSTPVGAMNANGEQSN